MGLKTHLTGKSAIPLTPSRQPAAKVQGPVGRAWPRLSAQVRVGPGTRSRALLELDACSKITLFPERFPYSMGSSSQGERGQTSLFPLHR